MKKILIVAMLNLSIITVVAQTRHPLKGDEFAGPFPSWIKVTSGGDSVTDATGIIQAQLDKIGNDNSKSCVVFLPKGTYRITGTLRYSNKMSVSMIGEDPATTRIIWDGVKEGTMLEMNGTAYATVNRITFDGKSKAKVAIDQSWDGSEPGYFDTGNEFTDNTFTDVTFGIYGGHRGHGFAEVVIERCKFIRNTGSGISLGNFNALDVWVWNCLFVDCWLGVTNSFGAGNFRVYNSVFKNSKSSDIWMGHTGGFSIRDNYSFYSKQFVGAGFTANPSLVVIQANTVVDPTSDYVVAISNQGPISLIDNTFRMKEGTKGPIIGFWPHLTGSFFAIGNKYNVSNAYHASTKIETRDQIVSRASLMSLAEPTLPGTPPYLSRRVFEVPAGATTAEIQTLIDQATKEKNRSIVHLPFGLYNIDATLNIPATSDIQIIGDSYGDRKASLLKWTGAGKGPIMHIMGPSKATLKNLSLRDGDAIVVTGIDQPGSRVHTNQLSVGGGENQVIIDGLDYTKVMMVNFGIGGAKETSLKIKGGPLAAAGQNKGGRTIIYSGAQSNNKLTYDVSNGGNLLARDTWYESNNVGSYLSLTNDGTVTFDGCATYTAPSATIPQFFVNNFRGNLTIIGTSISQDLLIKGNGSKANVLSINNGLGKKLYIDNKSSPSATIKSLSNRVFDPKETMASGGSYQAQDLGNLDDEFLLKMLKHTRDVHGEELSSLPSNITDLRFHRVTIFGASNGLTLKASR